MQSRWWRLIKSSRYGAVLMKVLLHSYMTVIISNDYFITISYQTIQYNTILYHTIQCKPRRYRVWKRRLRSLKHRAPTLTTNLWYDMLSGHNITKHTQREYTVKLIEQWYLKVGWCCSISIILTTTGLRPPRSRQQYVSKSSLSVFSCCCDNLNTFNITSNH